MPALDLEKEEVREVVAVLRHAIVAQRNMAIYHSLKTATKREHLARAVAEAIRIARRHDFPVPSEEAVREVIGSAADVRELASMLLALAMSAGPGEPESEKEVEKA